MSADAGREALYAQLRERFLSSPEYRAALRSDPVGTLEADLGPLGDDERRWVQDVAGVGDEELVARVRGRVGAW